MRIFRYIALAIVFGALLYLLIVMLCLDPDQKRDTCQLIKARGFPCEVHAVTTYQGYIILMHRIPNHGKKPVILQTGLIGTSADFVMASAEVSRDPKVIGQNMGIELAKQGCDVWLSNNRGSKYGLNHTTLNTDSNEFWKFSFDEISQYDIPAIIDYVLNTTNYNKLHFIGHSQGSAVMFALLSQTEKYNKVVESFTAISPITRIGDAATSFRLLLTTIKPLLYSGGPIFTENVITETMLSVISQLPLAKNIFEFIFFSVTGPDYGQMDLKRLGVYTAHMPTSTSAQNLLHFDQLFNSNKFQKFNHGILKNLQIYGNHTPPEYNLTSITHKSIHVVYSDNDWFVPISGVQSLQADLPNGTDFYLISNPQTNHMDPLIGIDVAVEVTKKVLDILNIKLKFA